MDSFYLIDFWLILIYLIQGRKLYKTDYSSGHSNYDWWELWYEKLF